MTRLSPIALSVLLFFTSASGARAQPQKSAPRVPGTDVGRFQIISATEHQPMMLLDSVMGESWSLCDQDVTPKSAQPQTEVPMNYTLPRPKTTVTRVWCVVPKTSGLAGRDVER